MYGACGAIFFIDEHHPRSGCYGTGNNSSVCFQLRLISNNQRVHKSFLFVRIFTLRTCLPRKRRRQKSANNNFTCVQIIILSFRLLEAMGSKNDSEDMTHSFDVINAERQRFLFTQIQTHSRVLGWTVCGCLWDYTPQKKNKICFIGLIFLR